MSTSARPSRPRSQTFTTEPSKRRYSISAESDTDTAAEEGVTKEPAAAYISTRISPPASPLPHYDSYKEQRLYNYVMSTSSTNSPARHARGKSIGPIPENGNFFANLFNGAPASNGPAPQRHARSQSLTNQQAAAGASRKLSNFFGLGVNSETSSNSGLAFSSASSSKRSVSNSTTLSHLVLPGELQAQGPMTRDEFAGMDFAELLSNGIPSSPLNCTPQGFNGLKDRSLDLVEKLYAGYMERTRALAEAFAEIEALRDDLEQKDQKIEGLRFTVDQLANVQETLSKAAEDAEKSAEKANTELKKVKEEKDRMQWETRSIRHVPSDAEDDAISIRSSKSYGVRGKIPTPPMHTRTKSSNSDSGFESDTDSGSVFSRDYSSFGSKSVENSPAPNYPAFVITSDEQAYELDASASKPAQSAGPLQQLRNVLRRTAAAADGNCDCKIMVNRLKHENGHLVTRVKELEGCLDNCLDLVGGI